MELQDYKDKLQALKERHKKEINDLHIEYGMSTAKYKKDDIISSYVGVLKVDNITTSITFGGLPEPVYHGYELKKDLKPKKNNSRIAIYGNNSVTLIKSAD